MNNMWIMTSDLMISISNDDVIRLDGKTVTISFKPEPGLTTKEEPAFIISFPCEDDAIKAWALLNEAFSKNHRYLNLESGFTTMKDRLVARRRCFLRR